MHSYSGIRSIECVLTLYVQYFMEKQIITRKWNVVKCDYTTLKNDESYAYTSAARESLVGLTVNTSESVGLNDFA